MINTASKTVNIYGLGGDAIQVPEHTITAFWSCLGAGGDGFLTGVRLSQDGVVVCIGEDAFLKYSRDKRNVAETNWSDIQDIDAGEKFRSRWDNPTEPSEIILGEDQPWKGDASNKSTLRFPALKEVLELFGRRCDIGILLPDNPRELSEATLSLLNQYGLLKRVALVGSLEMCKDIISKHPDANCVLVAKTEIPLSKQLDFASTLGIRIMLVDYNDVVIEGSIDETTLGEAATKGVALSVRCNHKRLHSKNVLEQLSGFPAVESITTNEVLKTVETITPPYLIVSDDFKGEIIDQSKWSAGYSHSNQDTEIYQKNKIHIKIKPGGSYSGAAVILVLPIRGRFDAIVDFKVKNPTQGTTFEMAAISIDPGYFRIDNSDLNSRKVNLTFDVHGAPPYASSERDENDGFRCGWNNGFNLAKIDPEWNAASVNMFNKYGRDVGYGKADSPKGSLRLIRNGSVFTTYYRDKFNKGWVCSGTMLVPNLSDDVYIRLAAKHWDKGGKPCPGNHVRFSNFKLFQF